jgi:hypothetical protein
MAAFCLKGQNEKIEIIINEVLGFPNQTSYEGGYDFVGTLNICVGCYNVHCEKFYSSTGILYRLLIGLNHCYASLSGIAEYKHLLEKNLVFTLEMTQNGRALVSGTFMEYYHINNSLTFEMETDQTCIADAIRGLKNVEMYFGDNLGNRGK